MSLMGLSLPDWHMSNVYIYIYIYIHIIYDPIIFSMSYIQYVIMLLFRLNEFPHNSHNVPSSNYKAQIAGSSQRMGTKY